MKLGDLFTQEWKCYASERWPEDKPECTESRRSEFVAHKGCGYRMVARYLPEDFERIKDMTLVSPESVTLLQKVLLERGMEKGFPELIGQGRFVTREVGQ